jgi:hypothetical protein
VSWPSRLQGSRKMISAFGGLRVERDLRSDAISRLSRVSDSLPDDRSSQAPTGAAQPPVKAGDTEEVDAVLVSAGTTALPTAPQSRAVVPAVQAAAVAATGFFAGAAAAGLVRRRRRRRELARTGSPRRRVAVRSGRAARGGVGELVQIVGSRSLLVDVHLLGGRD